MHLDLESNLPLVDAEQFEILFDLSSNDIGMNEIGRIFELFYVESVAKLEGLERVCETNDLDRLREMLHFVAGSAGNLGLVRLHQMLRDTEVELRTGELTDIRLYAASIRYLFDKSVAAYREHAKLLQAS